jgi:hypothetical protein
MAGLFRFVSVCFGGPCRVLKLREMGTKGVHMKEVLPCFVPWAHCAGTRDFCPALALLVCPVQNIFFLFHFIVLGSWAGSRAASPVAKYVSLVLVNLVRVGYTHAEIC